MIFGSICSGIEAASTAWEPLGWRAAWVAEIEPFPSAVLAHHWPEVPNLGDFTKIRDRLESWESPAPEVLVGGTPCQAFSVAGLRQSMDDARGQLTLEFVRLANAIDATRSFLGIPECIVVWENVPGVLNTPDNAFGCFLAGLAGEDDPLLPPGGRWTNAGRVLGPSRAVAWRILDAQYFGVAQRRRRVFVVASARKEFDPAAVLFELDGVRRDSPPSREAGQDFAHDVAPCLTSGGRGVERTGETREQDPVVAVRTAQTGANGIGVAFEVAHTLDQANGQAVAFGGNRTSGPIDVSPALNASASASGRQDFESEAFVVEPIGLDEEQNAFVNGFGTLKARTLGGGFEGSVMQPDLQVRRLTPTECERLQGFPDGHTRIPWRGKDADECPDGPRYKALGNSMAVPVMRWIGERIEKVTSLHQKEMEVG